MKILMVCTGNMCRSPMAEVMLRDALARRGCEDVEVASAGTWANYGRETTPEAASVLSKIGLDLSAHRSRPLDPREIATADLVVAMTSVHRKEITKVAPDAADKVVLLKELMAMARPHDDIDATQERLAAFLASERPPYRRALDVDDPMGLPIGAYERCLQDLRGGIDALADALCVSRSETRSEPVDRSS